MSPHHDIILYRNISNDFAEKLVFKIKEKICEERRFGVWKTLKTQELPGALPPGPPPGRCPWTPPGALERAPGPHAVKTLRSLRSTWTQTIFLQHPAVTNPAHAHVHVTLYGYVFWFFSVIYSVFDITLCYSAALSFFCVCVWFTVIFCWLFLM